MSITTRLFLALGGLTALIGVALGAFGAHALRERLSAEMLAVWRTGVEYQLVHALGLIAVGVVVIALPNSDLLKWSGWLMLAGILLFSGSLYALALTGARGFGALTPAGGAAFIVAWALFIAGVLRG